MPPFVKRPEMPPGRLLPGDRTCHRCNSLLADPTSQAVILAGDPPFEYRLRYQDLRASADLGCILCMLIFDRHEQFGPSLSSSVSHEIGDSSKGKVQAEENPKFIFTIQNWEDESEKSGGLRTLLVKGDSKDGAGKWDISLAVRARPNDPAAPFVPLRPPELDMISDVTRGLAQKWLKDCLLHHQDCRQDPISFLPTRLVELTKSETRVRLYTTKLAESGTYVALSYCWGGDQPARTTKDALLLYTDSILTANLPQTLKDAITVTRTLGHRFLWVDSLCIIQDDEDDKRREISKMHDIFENAVYTISAASARKSTDGFLRQLKPMNSSVSIFGWRSHDYYTTFELKFRCPDGTLSHVYLSETLEAVKLDEVITERAWTLQESLLSSRMLVYGNWGMFWRCRCCFKTTCDTITWNLWGLNAPILSLFKQLPIHSTSGKLNLPPTLMYTFGNDLYTVKPDSTTVIDRPNMKISEAVRKWMDLVPLYSSRSLSESHDKFPAIGAIAAKIHAATGANYVAGLWEESMLAGLSWRRSLYAHAVRRPYTQEFGDFSSWRAPSWSWASIDGPVVYPNYDVHWQTMDPRAHIHRVVTDPLDKSAPFQRLWHAEILIEGWLRRVDIEPISAAEWPNPTGSRRAELRFADVFILESQPTEDDDGLPSRCGSAIMDESIDAVPYEWTHPHGLDEIYVLPLFASRSWVAHGKGHRVHGLLLVKWPIGNYNRVGWFDSFALSFENFKRWFGKDNHMVIEIL